MEAIGEEQTTALAGLKSSDELISESLRTELEATRKQLSQRVFDFDQMKDQFMGVLVSKDKIQKRLDDALAAAPVPNEEEAPKSKKEDAEKIEKLKTALRQKMEVSNVYASQLNSPYMASSPGRDCEEHCCPGCRLLRLGYLSRRSRGRKPVLTRSGAAYHPSPFACLPSFFVRVSSVFVTLADLVSPSSN